MEDEWIVFNDVNELDPGAYLIRRYDYAENRFETELSFVENEDGSLVHRIMKYSDGTKYTWAALSTIVAYKTCDASDPSKCEIVKAAYDPLTKMYIEIGKVDDARFDWKWYDYKSKPAKSGTYICIYGCKTNGKCKTNGEKRKGFVRLVTYKKDSDKWYFVSINENDINGFYTTIGLCEAHDIQYYADIPVKINLPYDVDEVYINE